MIIIRCMTDVYIKLCKWKKEGGKSRKVIAHDTFTSCHGTSIHVHVYIYIYIYIYTHVLYLPTNIYHVIHYRSSMSTVKAPQFISLKIKSRVCVPNVCRVRNSDG